MGSFDAFFWLIPLAFIGYFAWRYVRSGSLTGAMLGGRSTNAVGEIELKAPALTSLVLKVHVLEMKSEAESQVALAIVSKAPMGASMVPIKMSNAQAKELASMLEAAAQLATNLGAAR